MSATRTHRSAEDWDALATEVLPELQAGRRISDFAERIGTNSDALRTALARQGYDPRGEALEVKEITASRPSTLAKRVAQRRQDKAPWWLLIAETNKSYGELRALLQDHGYSYRGEPQGNGNGNDSGAADAE